MTRKHHLAVSAIAVALAFGFSSVDAIVRADTTVVTIESLQDRLIDLRDQANNIQNRADAESRELTEDEQREVEQIFAAFNATEADIERRQRLDQINNKMATPQPRRTTPEQLPGDDGGEGGGNPQAGARQRPASTSPRAFAAPRSADSGKWGFRSFAEFTMAVLKSSSKGAQIDPRLIANAAPTSFGSEGVGQDGGFGVPPDFRQTIMQKVMGEDALLPLTDQQVSSGNSITFPADETTPWQSSGGIQAYWESEGGLKQQSKPALVEKTVKLNKIIALVPMTDELLEDAPAMGSYVNRKAPEKINARINEAIMAGTGVGMPLGILNSPGTIVVPKEAGQPADSVLFANITKLWTSITPTARRNARWLMNADIEQQLMTMQFPGTGTAVPAYMPPGGLSGAPYGTLLGRPIIYTEAAPALGDQGDIVFGDLSAYLSGVKTGGIKNDVSIHLWFDYDLTAFRFVLRVGGQPWWNSPIQPAQPGASARGFFATLGPRT